LILAARLSAFQRASLPPTFILDSATKKRLHAIAKSESRSVSGQLRVIVEKFVEQYEGIGYSAIPDWYISPLKYSFKYSARTRSKRWGVSAFTSP
jgi:hypothetical protein